MFDSMLLLMEAWLPPSDADQKRMGRFQWQVKDPIPFVKMQPLFIGLLYYPVSVFSCGKVVVLPHPWSPQGFQLSTLLSVSSNKIFSGGGAHWNPIKESGAHSIMM